MNLERTQAEKGRYRLTQNVKEALELRVTQMTESAHDDAMALGDEVRPVNISPRIDPEWNTLKTIGEVGRQGQEGHRRLLLAHVHGACNFQVSVRNIEALLDRDGDWLREEVDDQARM